MKDKGTLVVISGFSGAGKGTVSEALVEKFGYKSFGFGNNPSAERRRTGRKRILL